MSSMVTDWNIYQNFKANEFTCRCGCGTNRVSKILVDKLQQARTAAGIPFIINSACRCPNHNRSVSNSTASDHIADSNNLCFGVDIMCIESRSRFTIYRALMQVGLNRFGFHDRFIHVGMGRRLGGRMDDDVMWSY